MQAVLSRNTDQGANDQMCRDVEERIGGKCVSYKFVPLIDFDKAFQLWYYSSCIYQGYFLWQCELHVCKTVAIDRNEIRLQTFAKNFKIKYSNCDKTKQESFLNFVILHVTQNTVPFSEFALAAKSHMGGGKAKISKDRPKIYGSKNLIVVSFTVLGSRVSK